MKAGKPMAAAIALMLLCLKMSLDVRSLKVAEDSKTKVSSNGLHRDVRELGDPLLLESKESPLMRKGIARLETDMVVLVLSRRESYSIRKAIRETWGTNSVRFVVGSCCLLPRSHVLRWTCTRNTEKPVPTARDLRKAEEGCAASEARLNAESNEFKDIIFAPTVDVYRNLPQKLRAGYAWALANTTALWILKTGEDSVVRIDELNAYVRTSLNAFVPTVYGYIPNARVAESEISVKDQDSHSAFHGSQPTMLRRTSGLSLKRITVSIFVYTSFINRVRDIEPLYMPCNGGGAAVHFTVKHFAGSNCKNCPLKMLSVAHTTPFGRTISMMKTWYERPTDWVFKIDDDTWLHTPTLANTVCGMDSAVPYYGGFVMESQGIRFASGGAGYLLSAATMRIADFQGRCQGGHPYEDVALAKCLAKVGIAPNDLSGVHPDTPEKMLEWCAKPSYDHRSRHCEGVASAITYHYVSPARILRWTPGRNFPKRIHQIWLGSAVPPLHLLQTCSELHPDWEYTLWDQKAIDKLTSDSKYQRDGSWTARLHPTNNILKRVDLLKLEILYRFGGIAMDADQYCIRRLDPILDYGQEHDWLGVREHEHHGSSVKELVANGVQAAHANSPTVYNVLRLALGNLRDGPAWQRTGPCLVSQGIVEACAPADRLLRLCGGSVLKKGTFCGHTRAPIAILPSATFYPYHHSEREAMKRCEHSIEHSFTVQQWGSTHEIYKQFGKTGSAGLRAHGTIIRLDESTAVYQGAWNKRECLQHGLLGRPLAKVPNANASVVHSFDKWTIPPNATVHFDGPLLLEVLVFKVELCGCDGCVDRHVGRVWQTKHRLTTMRIFGHSPTVNIYLGGRQLSNALRCTVRRENRAYKPKKYPFLSLRSHGHVVNRPVARGIVESQDKLFNYQGGDVSVEVWLDSSTLKRDIKWIDCKHCASHGDCFNTSLWMIGNEVTAAKMRKCFHATTKGTILSELVNPRSLLLSQRFDIVVKAVYAAFVVAKDPMPRFVAAMYDRHLEVWNHFQEPCTFMGDADWFDSRKPCTKKTSAKDFRSSFHATIQSIRGRGMDPSISLVPVTKTGFPLNGAHRIAAAIALGKESMSIQRAKKQHAFDWGFSFFQHQGMESKYTDFAMLEWTLRFPTTTVVIWPRATAMTLKLAKTKAIVSKEIGEVLYETVISVTRRGLASLVFHAYGKQLWLTQKVSDLVGTESELQIRVLFLNTPFFSAQRAKSAKEDVRKHYGIAKSSVHVSDTPHEAALVAEMVLNPNSRMYLNKHEGGGCSVVANEIAARLNVEPVMPSMFLLPQTIMVDSGAVMSFFGLRPRTDVDVLFLGDVNHNVLGNRNGMSIEPHTFATTNRGPGGWKWGQRDWGAEHLNGMNAIDLFYNPSNYGFCHGLRFVSLSQLARYKTSRGEKGKDERDVILIRKLWERPVGG